MPEWNNELSHHGILGMKWGIRRFQPYPDGQKKGKEVGEAAKPPKPKYISSSKRSEIYKTRRTEFGKVFDKISKESGHAKALSDYEKLIARWEKEDSTGKTHSQKDYDKHDAMWKKVEQLEARTHEMANNKIDRLMKSKFGDTYIADIKHSDDVDRRIAKALIIAAAVPTAFFWYAGM